MMKPYQTQIHDEKFDLERRRKTLSAFLASMIFTTLPNHEQERIRRQIGIMAEYSGILQERIDHFPKG